MRERSHKGNILPMRTITNVCRQVRRVSKFKAGRNFIKDFKTIRTPNQLLLFPLVQQIKMTWKFFSICVLRIMEITKHWAIKSICTTAENISGLVKTVRYILAICLTDVLETLKISYFPLWCQRNTTTTKFVQTNTFIIELSSLQLFW
jgi:hypothetical protein